VTALLENCHHIVTDKLEMCDILYFLILPQKTPVPSSNLDISHSSNEQEDSDIVPVVFSIIVQICTHRILIVLLLNETEVITGIIYFHVHYELENTAAAL
jgi:hypothetical protein